MRPLSIARLFGWLWLGLLAPVSAAQAGTVHVAMAANFQAPMEVLRPVFEAETGHRLIISAGATGLLYAQIRQGGPFEVFVAADQARPEAAIEDGLALPDGRITYATGRLILLFAGEMPEGDPPDLSGIGTLSIANPATAPYGAAAREVLSQLDLPETLRIARARSVAGVNAALATGAVAAGFAALSSVMRPGQDPPRGWVVPERMYRPLRQDAVLLLAGAENPAARAFLAHLASPPAREIIRSFGYGVD